MIAPAQVCPHKICTHWRNKLCNP